MEITDQFDLIRTTACFQILSKYVVIAYVITIISLVVLFVYLFNYSLIVGLIIEITSIISVGYY